MRLALRVGLAVLVILAALGLAVSSRGSYERISLAPSTQSQTADAPARAACRSETPRRDRRLIERCVRVHGILLWVRRGYDAGGRLDEIHLLVSAHFHLYVVKLHAPFPARLQRGHSVTAAGPLLETEPTRFGIHEVEAFSFAAGD